MERRTAWIPWLLIPMILSDVTGLQFTPVALSGVGDGDCALLLNGPGRSSSFDYNLNVLRGGNGFGYNGHQTCITYDAVNSAYLEARKRVQVAQPHGDYKAEDFATVGELLLDISVNLARTYGLSYEDIEKGLPLIDTSKTLIREVCPPVLSNVECRPGKYRRFDGLCTNLQNPTWGATMQPFTRLIGPLYADGMNAPRISVTGNQLPLSRVVSRTMHPDDGFHDHAGTVMVIAWGQFMDHDYTLTATPLDPLNRNDPEECCKRPPHLKNPYCNEIHIPEDDYFYRLFNVRCMDFVRGFPAARPGCRLGSRSQFNTLTGVLDANTVYGVTEKFARKLRSGYGGQMRMNPVFRDYGLKDLLPLKLDIPDEGCTRPNRSMYCFEAGEIRVNEQLVLTCMHTLMAREHNRVAEGLAHVNPHWDDETLFQEARRINIAEVQHITFNEFLPILLGKEVMEKFGLLLQKDGYWDGHDPSVNPNVIDAFAAAAYRFGHSLLPTAVERWSKAHKFIASKRLSDLIRRPYDLYRAGVIDEYFMGLMNQVAQAMDDSITQEVTNHLFKKVGARYGMDLVSFNMQRGREFGLPGYMEFRKFCGLPGADTFDELFGSMPNETIKRYSSIFEHPHDVDLWSGGVSERPLPGSMLGPTFACIIATQFSYSRRGDRFWYELPNQPSSFTPDQLKEIKKARLARVICDNTDLIDSIQLYPMVLPDHEINPRVPCRSGVLPSMDFSKWADHGSPHFQQQQQFTTNNLVESSAIHPKIISVAKEALHKKILESNLNGKHPYASLFKSQPVKNIKILPPLLLKPNLVTKEVITIHRSKRNTKNIAENITETVQNATVKNTTERTEVETQENGTISPLIDQVTQAITVTQISGTPPPKPNTNSGPLNYQPFIITSSDFRNTTDNQNFENLNNKFIDVGKLIQEKLEKITDPQSFKDDHEAENLGENEDEESQKEEKRLEEEDDNEEIVNEESEEELDEQKEEINKATEEEPEEQKDEIVNEETEDESVEQKDEIINEETEDESEEPKTEKLVIHVPESSSNEETVNDQNEELEEPIENLPESTPEIPQSFAKHFIEMGAIEPKQVTHESKTPKKSNFQINEEKFYLPLRVDESEESNEEIKEKNSYFDDIINHQFKQNKKLQQELEYPDLDNEYEKYRENAENEYLQDKATDYSVVEKPYVINLDGIFPYEERQAENEEEERDYKDDVDTGTDKERLEQDHEEYKDNKDAEENVQPVEEDEREEYKKEAKTEDEQPKEQLENEEIEEYTDEPEEVEEKVSSDKKITVVPVVTPKQKRRIDKDSQINESKLKNIEEIQVAATENIVEALNNIMKKRDAISRQQQIENPKEFNTFWSLEYKIPNPK